MNTYRLYSVDRTGKITSAERLFAECDDDAVKIARALSRDCSCEIWKGHTFVAAISTVAEMPQLQIVR